MQNHKNALLSAVNALSQRDGQTAPTPQTSLEQQLEAISRILSDAQVNHINAVHAALYATKSEEQAKLLIEKLMLRRDLIKIEMGVLEECGSCNRKFPADPYKQGVCDKCHNDDPQEGA